MKKAITAVIMVLLLLCSCGTQAADGGGSDIGRVMSSFSNIGEGGELYTDSRGRLHFCDFTTMADVYICPSPNCPHTDPKSCSSFGMDCCPILYGGNIYFFENSTEYTGNGIEYTAKLYKANTDGTGRIKMAELNGLSVEGYSRILLFDGKIYFCPQKIEFTDAGVSTSHGSAYLYSYDFADNKLLELGKLAEGYSCNTWIFGEFCGDIYLNYSYAENEYDYNILFDENAESPFTVKNAKYNLKSRSFEELDYTIDYISGGYLFTSVDQDSMTMHCPDGSQIKVPHFGDVSVLNGYVFDRTSLLAYEISTGKSFKLKTDDKMAEFIYYEDGEYTLRKYGKDSERVYSNVVQADIIGAEIS